MKRRTAEQVVQLLYDVDEELGKGKTIEDICQEKEISPATYHRWKEKYSSRSQADQSA